MSEVFSKEIPNNFKKIEKWLYAGAISTLAVIGANILPVQAETQQENKKISTEASDIVEKPKLQEEIRVIKNIVPIWNLDPMTAGYLKEKNAVLTVEGLITPDQFEQLKSCLATSQNIIPKITVTAQGCNIQFFGENETNSFSLQGVVKVAPSVAVYGVGEVSDSGQNRDVFGVSAFGTDGGAFIEYSTNGTVFFRGVYGF